MIQHNTTTRYKENGPKESGHLSAATFKQMKSYVDDKCCSLYQTMVCQIVTHRFVN